MEEGTGNRGELRVEPSLSLPGNPNADRPRPSLSVDLTIDGELVRILAVHLKSSCVSPLEASGNLSDDQDRDCRLLQQQIVPLETWLEDLASTDKFIVLGDFNRNFWHEVHETGPVRTDGSSPHTPLPPPGVLVQDLFGEVFDDTPASTTVTLLRERCPAQFSKDNALREGRSRTIDGRRTPSAQSVTKPRLPQSARSRSHFDWARTCQHRRCGARRDRRLWGNKTRKRPSSRSLACDFGPLPFKRQVGFLKKTDASVR